MVNTGGGVREAANSVIFRVASESREGGQGFIHEQAAWAECCLQMEMSLKCIQTVRVWDGFTSSHVLSLSETLLVVLVLCCCMSNNIVLELLFYCLVRVSINISIWETGTQSSWATT